jgi:diguanylate cyclase (GGDEF)-like protein
MFSSCSAMEFCSIIKKMKNDKEKKISDAAEIYIHEFQLLKRVNDIKNNPSLTLNELMSEYTKLGNEYSKLLKQTIKMTRVGDSNQKKLFQANEQIEKQKEKLSIAYKQVELLARTDSLTGLSNRRDFYEKFRDEIHRFERNGKSFSILLGDIDDFKSINDRYGHDCGDFVLTSISGIMRSMIRKQDIVARWGGEEFILLLPEAPLQGGIKVAESIRSRMEKEIFQFNNHELSITLTFGVSEYEGAIGIDACIKKADEGLLSGKQKGKNRVFY